MVASAPTMPGVTVATTYTPSQLRLAHTTLVRRERKLPRPGDILVQIGQHVPANAVIGRARIPAEPWLVSVGRQLSFNGDITKYMVKQIGDAVNEGDVIAAKGFGPLRKVVRTPVSGIVSSITPSLGQVSIMPRPTDMEVMAGLSGTVVSVLPSRSVTIESPVIYVQGTAGNWREGVGLLKPLGEGPGDTLRPEMIDESCQGQILVAGNLGTDIAAARAVVVNAVNHGVAGIIAGSIEATVFLEILANRPVNVPFPVVVTDGFGSIPMMEPIWEWLRIAQARVASILMGEGERYERRPPEILVPLGDIQPQPPLLAPLQFGVGSVVRLLCGPVPLGTLARVINIPPEAQNLNGMHVHVVEVELGDGKTIVIPRNNIQLVG